MRFPVNFGKFLRITYGGNIALWRKFCSCNPETLSTNKFSLYEIAKRQ